ncbi:hypothetical protein CARUB_v10019619mg [Capsella rubella]|uniref:Uncharacterized protein n=1 Tax=Capsella rubella TaxID=81985 RepID=R0FUF5_9BRAS|nr:UPF0481 protein At3g47200 [Capsella rubella]EOA26181.1 hypothetical protein CARUB_v10019619mg [Capsella rubella]
MERILDLESGTIHESNKPAPGMWRFPTNPDLCCIYGVPNCLRQVNPEAYTPHLVLIGPLHHSLKSLALKSRGDITNTKLMGYLNMEEHKKVYLVEFARRVEGTKAIDGFRRIIEEDEDIIRASYSESTAWIPSSEFVDMVLHDSVFILELILRLYVQGPEKIGDPIMDEPCLAHTVTGDLILLENQLPYFILKKLFDPIVSMLCPYQTFRELTVIHFGLQNKIGNNSKFRHFTDLVRCVRVETVPDHGFGIFKPMYDMYSADKLDTGGVKFKAVEDELSVEVKFKNGVLNIPCFLADDDAEMILRNIMALEQCHYPFNAHVCNYIMFLDFLIDTHKDVDLLVEKGIINNCLGDHRAVAKMVNKLSVGVMHDGSYYSDIATEVVKHYNNKCNKSHAILRRVYCSDLWTGTATVAAACLLLMTLIQTVSSVIPIIKK